MRKKIVLAALALLAVLAGIIAVSGTASAAVTIVSTPADPHGWVADGAVYSSDRPFPAGSTGSLKLSTPLDSSSVGIEHSVPSVPLADYTASYSWFKANAGSASITAAYYVTTNIPCTGADRTASLVYEPVYNHATPLPTGEWVAAEGIQDGKWWSDCTIAGTAERGHECGGPPACASLSAIATANAASTAPLAPSVNAFGVFQGSGTPGVVSYADLVTFNGNITNFELNPVPSPPVTYTLNSSKVTVGVSYNGTSFLLLPVNKTTKDLGRNQSARYILNGGGYCIHMAWNDGGSTWTPYVNRYSATRVVVGPFSGAHNWRVIATRGVCHTNTT